MGTIIIADCEYGNIVEKYFSFDENTDIGVLLGYATNWLAFRIPFGDDRKIWNDIVKNDWAGLDDGDYYSYNQPIVSNADWYVEHDGGYFDNLKEVIKMNEEYLKKLKKIKPIQLPKKSLWEN